VFPAEEKGEMKSSDSPLSVPLKPTSDLLEKLRALNLLIANQNNTIEW
jgi:hypothetical protein